jgi:hypothetical protein
MCFNIWPILKRTRILQTFLPLPSMSNSVKCLDNKRLGKQRVEAHQILKALNGDYDKTGAWVNHPATKMWRGYEDGLEIYKNLCIEEWIKRGFKNTMQITSQKSSTESVLPPWFGDEFFHASHRSNLLRKDPDFYSQYNWAEPPDLKYIWPV